jgi:hypothetical protein
MNKTHPFAICSAILLSLAAQPAIAADPAPAVSTSPVSSTADSQGYVPEPRHFFRALGETVIIGWSPWIFSHYIKDYEYADISMDSVRRNFSNPPWWDADGFHTNMWGHPFQGSMYYNAARENGFSFWESAPFVALGDFGWEYLMETEPPAYNDMSNTFFGGMSRGEMTHRLSLTIRDNRAHGWEKFWRELGAGFVNPVGFLDRMVFGDMWKDAPNPPDRFPSKLFVMLDGGYQNSRKSAQTPDSGFFNFDLRYNDPHDTYVKKPFDYFDMESTFATGDGPLLPWITYRGLLGAVHLKDEERVDHLLAPALTFNYFNNGPASFGGSGLDFMLFSRWKIPHEFDIRTEVGAQAYIAAGIQTDYATDNVSATGRNYDFGSGGGPKIDFRLRRNRVDWLRATVVAGWFGTHHGLSSQNRIFLVNTEARYPVTQDLYAGVGWSLQDRQTLYDTLPSVTRTNSEIKGFLSYAFRIID